MITPEEKEKILEIADKYQVKVLYIFGSAVENDTYNDIDIAVKGIKPEYFFKFYGELLSSLSKHVDIVDLSRKTRFNKIIERDAVKIYG